MAEVLLARCAGAGGLVREVALKCITPGLELDEGARTAFLHEAELAIRLRHPNIVEAYDFVEAGDRCYLVLEYIEGLSLKSVVQAARRNQKKLSRGFCCHVVASVAEALHYAHCRTDADGRPLGVVHRDVSPGNIMIAESGAVKLLDFGIALARVEGRDRTRTGNLKGTYSYLSPEQASRGALDGRSDLFSLGSVLVELLTGIRTFDGVDDLDTVQRVGQCAPADIAAATGSLPEGLREICGKALAKSPAERFQRGAEFSRALRDYLLEEGVSYWPSDCAAEVGALGGRAGPASAHENPAAVTVKRLATKPTTGDLEGGPLTAAEQGSELGPWHRGPIRRVATGIVLVIASLVATMVLLRDGRSRAPPRLGLPVTVAAVSRAAPTPPALPEPKMVYPKGTAAELMSTPVPVETSVVAALSLVTPIPDAPVVRLKKKAATVSHKASIGYESRSGVPHHAAGTKVESGTLPRGTLVRARLAAPVDPAKAAVVEAVVAENVMSAAGVLVPAGSTLVCSSRVSKDGRVPVSCDAIRTANRSWSFSGLAVGEGQHFGLRVVDTAVPAGSSFVVYVDAEFR
jgi:eukaryotic-like serine/threonine-protein kinase